MKIFFKKLKSSPDPAGHIETLESRKGVTIVRLNGRLTFDTLKAAWDEFVSKTSGKKMRSILFDLKGAGEVDSSGIAALIELSKYMKENRLGDRIGLVNLTPKMRALMEISKTTTLFKEYSSEERAINALKRKAGAG